jgi:hypothetical protein
LLFEVTSLRGRALFLSLSLSLYTLSTNLSLFDFVPSISYVFPVRLLFLVVVLACS